jgi:proline iminopeptidase
MREKPTVLLLHGGPGFDHSLFKPWFSALADVAQLVYLDHRGNGRSDRSTPEKLNLEQWGDDVHALCNALEIHAPIVIGVSFGGFVAQAYATRHPDHPQALVLCNTAARFRVDRSLDAFERLGGREVRDAAAGYLCGASAETLPDFVRLCTPVYNRRPQDPDLMTRALPNANFELCTAFFRDELHRFDFRAALGGVRCPTLVVGGSEDPITAFADSEDLAAALPAALVRLEKFSDCGHPVYQDDQAGFVRTVRAFLAAC